MFFPLAAKDSGLKMHAFLFGKAYDRSRFLFLGISSFSPGIFVGNVAVLVLGRFGSTLRCCRRCSPFLAFSKSY